MKSSSNSSNSSKGEGNTKTSPSQEKKQISPSKHWVFTLNNYKEEDLKLFSSIVPDICDKCIIGKEVGESGTPHLQGYIKFKTKVRPMGIFKECKAIHWEIKKKYATEMDNFKYCSKDGNIFINIGFPKPVVKVSYDMLRPNQKVIVDAFKEDENAIFGRKIHWKWETTGNWGKSFLCLHMIDYCGAFVCEGANKDILYGLKEWIEKHGECPRIVIFDIPRVSEGHVSYKAIESVKNGFFYSSKYEGGMCRFNKPHILCFANEPPDYSKLSEDRWMSQNLLGEDDIKKWSYERDLDSKYLLHMNL